MSWAAAAVAAATVYSANRGAGAATDAASIQAAASQYAADVQKAMFEKQNTQQTGYRAAGQNALANIGALGTGQYQRYDEAGNPVGTPETGTGYLQKRFTAKDFAEGIDPSYAWRLQQGEEATRRAANVGGGQISGNTLKALNDYSQNSASTEYANAFNRFQTERGNIYNTLASIAGLGQTSLGQTGAQSATVAGNIGNAIQAGGAAQAAGIVGSANAYTGAVQSLGNQYYMSQLLKPKGDGGGGGGYNLPSSTADYTAGSYRPISGE